MVKKEHNNGSHPPKKLGEWIQHLNILKLEEMFLINTIRGLITTFNPFLTMVFKIMFLHLSTRSRLNHFAICFVNQF